MSEINIHMKPEISKRAFWDIDYENIKWDEDIRYITIKVILDGTFDDLLELYNFYGKEVIIRELVNSETLPESVYYFAKTIFNLSKEDFSCSITKQ